MNYIVAVEPFFQVTDGQNTVTYNDLTMLVFSLESDAYKPLYSVQNNISSTSNVVIIQTIVIICCIIAIDLIAIAIFINYLVKPLEEMRKISTEVVKLSAEDEDTRDYSSLIEKAFNNLSNRFDEIGLLATEYFNVICLLHNRNITKKNSPKHLMNIFHLESSNLSWEEFYALFSMKSNETILKSKVSLSTPNVKTHNDLDVLGSISASFDEKLSQTNNKGFQILPKDDISDSNVAIDVNHVKLDGLKESIKASPLNIFYSIKTQLYLFCILLLCGFACVLILTIVTLQKQGNAWTNSSKEQVINQQIDVLNAVSSPKATYVDSYLQQLSLETLLLSNFLSDLFNNEITSSSYLNQGNYLLSYSLEPTSTYTSPTSTSNEYSGYFISSEVGCSPSQCSTLQNSDFIRQSSLWDIKVKAFFYFGNYLSFVQMGLNATGLTRYFPYASSTTYTTPVTCTIQDESNPICAHDYATSKCNVFASFPNYPLYDPRCRTWFQQGIHSDDSVTFQYPRLSSSGKYVTTIVNAFHNISTHEVIGVVNFNVLVSKLSSSINSL